MITRSNAIAVLRVLIAAGWVDSRLSQSELNYIKALAQRFHLTDSDWAELQPHLEDATSQEEIDALFQDLLSRLGTPFARNEVIGYLEEILNADAHLTAEEHDFLEQYSMILKQASTVQLLVRRMKGLFQKRPPAALVDLDDFIRNKILFKLRRRTGADQITPELHRLCLLGGLMGIVAQADGEIAPHELDEIRQQLRFRGKFEPEILDMLLTIIQEESVRGLDRARLIAEYIGDATFQERVELLDLLFAIAGADGSLTHAELEEIRGVSSAMSLSHRQYIDAKVRARSKQEQ